MRKVPELRFDGFDGEWEEVQLGIEADVRDGTHDSPKYVNNGYPLITSKNIVNGKLDFEDISFISEEDFYLINKRSKVDIGDIIMPMIGTIGNPIILNRDDFAIKNVALIKKSNNLNNQFLLNLLNSKVFSRYLYRKNAGGTQKFIALGMIREFLFNRPTIEEQEKIGDLFRKIDALIEIQEGKVSKMEDFKKSMLQKMFPKKDELVPEFRFDGFDGEWKSSKLKHIGIVKSGVGFPEKFQGGISGIPFFKVSDMNLGSNNIIMKNAQNYVSESDIITNKWNVITDRPAIIFAKVGAAIFLERKRIVTEDFLIDNNMMAFIPKVKSDLYFLKVFLDTTRLAKYAQSGALPSYNANDIYSIPINLPSLEEQEKIGNFFKNLDTQIETEEKLLDSYKNMKKSLLQKMFV
ncbi:MAG: restriction endonuclease subunit S [Anaerococcus sp.]|nr:restriction endonuclease subunit S [Anaerococcus sp.]